MRPEIKPLHRSHKFRLLLLGIAVVAIIVGIFLWQQDSGNSGPHDPDANGGKEAEQTKPAINGLPVNLSVAERRPIGVIIENSPGARPQSGLAEADIIYETQAEGGITRFLALFQTQKPDSIGPIRSARDYFAQIANEWGVLFAHVGGSDEVLQQLAAKQYKQLDDANQFFYSPYFERLTSRSAPHNVYTSFEKLQEIITDKKLKTAASYEPWVFRSPETVSPANDAQTIVIKFSSGAFDVRYEFDPATKQYKRFVGGSIHRDNETKEQLTADTIIVQYVPISATPEDPKLRIDIGLSGQGKAYIFNNGTIIEGLWKKGKDGRTRYYDQSSNELSLVPGQLWIALTSSGTLSWKPAVAKSTTNQ